MAIILAMFLLSAVSQAETKSTRLPCGGCRKGYYCDRSLDYCKSCVYCPQNHTCREICGLMKSTTTGKPGEAEETDLSLGLSIGALVVVSVVILTVMYLKCCLKKHSEWFKKKLCRNAHNNNNRDEEQVQHLEEADPGQEEREEEAELDQHVEQEQVPEQEVHEEGTPVIGDIDDLVNITDY